MIRRLLGAKRYRAERYLLITIAAFAVTVAGTRWYLDLSGYPTIGGGELHFAHALWGGLALIVAALLPLLFAGRRALTISAVFAGIGVGLFIDEVGKFITTSNNYFFAPAAPMIYGSILLLVLLWLVVRRHSDNTHDATQAVVGTLGEGVDGRLTAAERDQAIEQLRRAQAEATDPDPLADLLAAALESPAMDARLASPGWLARGGGRSLLERILSARLEHALILIGLWLATIRAAIGIIVLLALQDTTLDVLEFLPEPDGRQELPQEPIWSLLGIGIGVVVGIGSIAAIVLSWRGRARQAMTVALGATITGLVAGGLVGFYAVQLTALASTLLDLFLVGLIIDFRRRTAASDGLGDSEVGVGSVDEEAG